MKQRASPYTATSRSKAERRLSEEEEASQVHTIRRSSPVKARASNGSLRPRSNTDRADSGDDEDDDLVDDLDEAAEHAALLQEQAEMRARFTFREPTKKTLGDQFAAAMRRKRRMLARNENLRFRELYKPPEPIAVVLVIAVATAVTLIITKTWPFHESV